MDNINEIRNHTLALENEGADTGAHLRELMDVLGQIVVGFVELLDRDAEAREDDEADEDYDEAVIS